MLVRVPVNFVFTDVATLGKYPPASVVKQAVTLMMQQKKADNAALKTINLEEEDNGIGMSISKLGLL